MNRYESPSPADRCWTRFWQSGKVEDYLSYCSAAENTAGNNRNKENPHADGNRSPGAAGTPAG